MWYMFLCYCSHFSAASNSKILPSSIVLWWLWMSPLLPPPLLLFLPPVLLLCISLLLLFVILYLLSGDPHGHFLLGDFTPRGCILVSLLTDGRGGGEVGGGSESLLFFLLCGGSRGWHSAVGDEADEDDHQWDQVESRELTQGKEWTGLT